ncbi:hypothetical protein AVEN_146504-1 [Araneus ventricosus]|uniref:Uncharacterized protein n=1 Tax=Araneus ventricosus TaxID=182803 RepID=A0A4Y2S1H5_ARAVE|nr:hypothetical protein AVEN_85827-1 [Araneus ventricosus]GBN81115.1 hypothetical protein AVEN_146504-1 [Araneus ventricosus]
MLKILGGSFITSFPKLACNQSTGHVTMFCFPKEINLSHRFSKYSNLPKPYSALVGEIGPPIHYETDCLTTASYYMAPPIQQHEPVWFRRVANNSSSRTNRHNLLQILQSETKPIFFVQIPFNCFFLPSLVFSQ